MQLEIGAVLEGKVNGITKFGAFIELEGGTVGMVHISEIASTYVKEIRDHITENQNVKVKVLSIEDGKVSLSIKKAMEPAGGKPNFNGNGGRNFKNDEPRNNRPRRRAPAPAVSPGRPGDFEWQSSSDKRDGGSNFEDMLNKFKQSSEEKISDLKKTMEGRSGGFTKRGGPRS